MRKTLFLSQAKESSHSNFKFKFEAPYIFFHGKWREDAWYFNSHKDIKEKAKKQGYLIA